MDETIIRRLTRKVMVGDVPIGGGEPIPVQSMTTTKTNDLSSTMKEVERLEESGCQIIRITVPDKKAAKVLPEIKKRMTVPLVADIHFNYRMALAAVDAALLRTFSSRTSCCKSSSAVACLGAVGTGWTSTGGVNGSG